MRAIADRLVFVKMKARRADEHFQSLEKEMAKWAAKSYTVTNKTDLKKSLYIVCIEITPTPQIIRCCSVIDLQHCSSLDQLAWRLAPLAPY